MKNVTISVDEETYSHARVVAARRGTSVSRLVSEFLSQIREKGQSTSGEWRALWKDIAADKARVGQRPSRKRTYADARVR